MKNVIVTGGFDNLRSSQVRFLEEAARLGELHVLLWPDETLQAQQGKPPTFPQEERLFLIRSIRYVKDVALIKGAVDVNALPPAIGFWPELWVVNEAGDDPRKRQYCQAYGLGYHCIRQVQLLGFPAVTFQPEAESAPRKKVIVTGCFDWFHSGHVRFFEEVSGLGDLYVVVGSQALISSGTGWMDAEPDIDLVKPDMYAVNEDGDKPEKRQFCLDHGIEYVVLKRTPKQGLPRRQSTDLRGY
jgi:cytidyltransferase-like protein